MNDAQRQILADHLDSVIRQIEEDDERITALEIRLHKLRAKREEYVKQKIALEEGIDW